MSSEFSCDYCSVSPRHPCYSKHEAAGCPNQDNPGMYLSFDKAEVFTWLRYQAGGMNQHAYDLIDKLEQEI